MDFYFGYFTPVRPDWADAMARTWPSMCFKVYWDGSEVCPRMYFAVREVGR